MKTRERAERRGAVPWQGLVAALAGIWLCMALVACGSGPSQAANATPTATTASSGGDQTQTTATTTPQQSGPGTPTSTPFGNGTPSAVLGATDVCVQQGPTSASLPSDIPAYPNAQLTVGSTNGGSGVFGLCSSDSVSAINSFYTSQLPSHGWQKITDEQPSDWSQITASQGNISLIVTISADTAVQGKTQILIIYSGS